MRKGTSDLLFEFMLNIRRCSCQLHTIYSAMDAADLAVWDTTFETIRQNLSDSSSFAADIILSSLNSEEK